MGFLTLYRIGHVAKATICTMGSYWSGDECVEFQYNFLSFEM